MMILSRYFTGLTATINLTTQALAQNNKAAVTPPKRRLGDTMNY